MVNTPLRLRPPTMSRTPTGCTETVAAFSRRILTDLLQRQVLGLVLVHRVDDLHGGQRVARKADHDVAVDLADLGQIVFEDMGFSPVMGSST
mgnify:CR=1 FL=1